MSEENEKSVPTDQVVKIDVEENGRAVRVEVVDSKIQPDTGQSMVGGITFGACMMACIPVKTVPVNRSMGGIYLVRIPLDRYTDPQRRAIRVGILLDVIASTFQRWGYTVLVAAEGYDVRQPKQPS